MSIVWRAPVGFRDQNLCLPKTSSIQPGVTFHHLQVNTGLSLAILVAFTVSNKDWETTHVVNQPPSQIQTHLCMVSIGTHGAKVITEIQATAHWLKFWQLQEFCSNHVFNCAFSTYICMTLYMHGKSETFGVLCLYFYVLSIQEYILIV